MAAFLWRGGDDWGSKNNRFAEQIAAIEMKPDSLDECLRDAFNEFRKVINDHAQFAADLDSAMKSNILDASMDRHLYQRKKSRNSAKK